MVQLRRATPDDLDTILPRTRALNAEEGIEIAEPALEAALRRLLADPALGGCWIIERGGAAGGAAIGYAIVTFGYDLEFGGRDAYLTELWIDPEARGGGAGSAALALLDGELRALEVRALHLMVRPENPAVRLYERAGFEASPRIFMTRRLD
ncbi:MAG TPA: GNAT family N-acetyltransferase [Kofleriaceae bacterium]|nr:GNAT family N-acetyltransferase [Kofleriaceae bacterium]